MNERTTKEIPIEGLEKEIKKLEKQGWKVVGYDFASAAHLSAVILERDKSKPAPHPKPKAKPKKKATKAKTVARVSVPKKTAKKKAKKKTK